MTILLEDGLFADIVKLTGAKTKSEAVRCSLREFVRLKRKEQLLALRGQLDIADDWQSLRALDVRELANG